MDRCFDCRVRETTLSRNNKKQIIDNGSDAWAWTANSELLELQVFCSFSAKFFQRKSFFKIWKADEAITRRPLLRKCDSSLILRQLVNVL